MTLEQQRRHREDLAAREKQASALAAAGMVAESVRLAQPPSGLLPPPPLANGSAPLTHSTTGEIDNIHWGIMDLNVGHLDDLDMDFASLFDPINEITNMHMAGSGWPVVGSSSEEDMMMKFENQSPTDGT